LRKSKAKELEAIVRELVLRAIKTAKSDFELAEKQALLSRKIWLKSRIRQPYELKLAFCKKCKRFSPPPIYSKVRLRKGWLLITCTRCGRTYRKKVKFKTNPNGQGRLK
jgi:ribonuclease P protein subunit RPR2